MSTLTPTTFTDLLDVYVRCRSLGHSWDDFFPPSTKPRSPYGHLLAYRCERCMTERYDHIDRRSGELQGRQYVYPDGYKMAKGSERPSAEELRVRIADIRERRAKRAKAKARKKIAS